MTQDIVRESTDLIERLIHGHSALVTVEQGSTGGFGALVLHHLAGQGLLELGRAIRTLTLPDRFIDQASPAQMYAWAGMSADDIARTLNADVVNRDGIKVRDLPGPLQQIMLDLQIGQL